MEKKSIKRATIVERKRASKAENYFPEGTEKPGQGGAKTGERSHGSGRGETKSELSLDILIKALIEFDRKFYFTRRKHKSDCHEWKVKYL